MFNNQAIRLTEGETFVVINQGRTFTPTTDASDLKIAELPTDVDRQPCPDFMRAEIQELINLIF